MDIYFYLKVIAALLIVLAIFGIVAFFLKKLEKIGLSPRNKDISIVEVVHIDVKRRLVQVAYRNKRYIVLLGNTDVLLDVIDEK